MCRHAPVLLVALLLPFAHLCAHASVTLEAAREISGLDESGAVPRGVTHLDIALHITASGTPGDLRALGIEERLPGLLAFDSVLEGAPEVVRFSAATGEVHFVWINPPAFPLTLRYRVQLLQPWLTEHLLGGEVRYRTEGEERSTPEMISPLPPGPGWDDQTPPVIHLLGAAEMRVDCGSGSFQDPGATAEHPLDGDLTAAVQVTGVVDTAHPGEYLLHYTVRDRVGNVAEPVIRRVEVRNVPAQISGITVFAPRTVYLPPNAASATVDVAAALQRKNDAGCPRGVVTLTYLLDGVSVGESTDLAGGFPMRLTLTPGLHALATRARIAGTGSTAEGEPWPLLVATAEDSNANGFPDEPFAILREEGDLWIAQADGLNCRRAVRMFSWFGGCDGPQGRIQLTLPLPDDPTQAVSVSVPRALAACGEQGILVLAHACDVDSLLGPDQAALLPAPPSIPVAGGSFFELSVLISGDAGETFAVVDPAVVRAHPVAITQTGLAFTPGLTPTFYSYPTRIAAGPGGAQVEVVAGEWSDAHVFNVSSLVGTLTAETRRLSLFGPFISPLQGPALRVDSATGGLFVVGSTAPGTAIEKTLTVRNIGSELARGVVQITSNPGDAFAIVGYGGYQLAPNETAVFPVRFSPAEAGTYTGAITFSGDARGPLTVQLRGTGVARPKIFALANCGSAPGERGRAGDLLSMLGAAALLGFALRRRQLGSPGSR